MSEPRGASAPLLRNQGTPPPGSPGPIAVWLGSSTPARSVRWLDGALEETAALAAAQGDGHATAIAAGDETWLYLAADRARRAGLACVGLPTDLRLDYLGWAQIAAAAVKHVKATLVLVDEVSRPERAAEVAAIAEQLDYAQLTHVVKIALNDGVVDAVRAADTKLQLCRVRGTAVIGVRIAGEPIDEYPTPVPSSALKRVDLAMLGLDANILAHRALPPRAPRDPRKTVDRVAELLALYTAPRRT